MALAPAQLPPRPVVGAVLAAVDVLADADSTKLWALTEPEVEAAMEGLAQLQAMAQAQMVAVLAEAKSRGLGCDQGWGAQDWARMHAPGLPTRTVADLDVVAGAATDLRLAALREAVAEGATPGVTDALEVGRAAQVVRFHEKVRGLAHAEQLEGITHDLVAAARGAGCLSERQLADPPDRGHARAGAPGRARG